MSMKRTGAQILCEGLIQEGVDIIFGFPGGYVLPFYDTLPQYPQIHHILVRHEQGAAHAADGYARVTGKVGVCLATSGPGATNLITGIANAHMDSIPLVAITGQVARPFIGKDAFQETDITGITQPITKHNYLVLDVNQLPHIIKEAFHIASSGRPGPVLIDIPRDVFIDQTEATAPSRLSMPGYKIPGPGHPTQVKKAARMIDEAQKPLILSGHGLLISGAEKELLEVAEKAQIPVVTTLLGIGGFSEAHILSYGWVGMHGQGYANRALESTDLLIAMGMRFDDRVTGKISAFCPNARVIHIDLDPAEIGKNVRVDVPIVGDLKKVLAALAKQVDKAERVDWIRELDGYRKRHPSLDIREHEGVLPQYVIKKVYELTGGEATIVTGVGQHQMWAAQHYTFTQPRTLVTSGGLGTMGYGLPAALGAKAGKPQEQVWLFDGDGSFQMTIQELGTAVQENLAVKIAILNNGYLGMVRQWQELFYGRRYVATPLSGPNFVKIAESYGMPGVAVSHREDVVPALEQAMRHDGPFLIDFHIEPEENVFPMVPPGAAVADIF